MADSDEIQPATSGTVLLIFIQVASRALTFLGNQFLLRFLSPTLLGISVQLELVSVSSLYFARESLRVALQRQPPASGKTRPLSGKDDRAKSRDQNSQAVVNLSYLVILLGLAVSTAFGYSYLHGVSAEVSSSPRFSMSFQIYAAATVIELLAEPAFAVIQQQQLFTGRARAETGASVARCFAACVAVVTEQRRGAASSIFPFAVGQLAYAMTLLLLYVQPIWKLSASRGFSLFPRPLGQISEQERYWMTYFHTRIMSLATTMYLQSIFKLLLTQGDALILSFLSSLADQGAFALTSNYGGLLARLVFQPVEESSRNTFGRLLHPTGGQPSGSKEGDATRVRRALEYLATVLHFYLLMALPLISIAPVALPLFVRHIVGARWYTPSTAALLSCYCYYIPLMAVNGILDAFVVSVATPAQIRRQSLWMLLFTAIYVVAAWSAVKTLGQGGMGLVMANILNMSLRIVWSVNFIRSWSKQQKGGNDRTQLWSRTVKETLPSRAAVAATVLLISSLATTSPLANSAPDSGDLNRKFLSIVVTGTVLLGFTM